VNVLTEPLPPLGDGTAASPRLVVDVWLGVPAGGGWRVLLLHRSPHRTAFWQGVSGRVEAHDGTLERAARREISEETGLAGGVDILDLGRWTTFQSPRTGTWFRKRSLGAVLPAGTGPATIRLSDEHDEARLATFEEARALVRFPLNTIELDALEAALVRGRAG
jgi:8-oxo-dGTP pyrophosphatase MutT (NUDIX family)